MNDSKRLQQRMWAVALGAGLALAVAGCQAPANPSTDAAPATVAQVTATVATTQATEAQAADPAADVAVTGKLNLNTATGDEFLAAIPDLGKRMVREFEEYRPYVSIQQFRREIGKYVDANQVAAYEQYVFVPVDPNNADAETLQQLPGVDATVAAELSAARPYASADAFLEKLGGYVNGDELAQAGSYLSVE